MAAIAGALSGTRAQAARQITAAQVVQAIKQHLNMPWDEKTYRDTFKAGDPNTPVRGIASCFMDTLSVLKRADAQKLNFVISHEPTFWTDADEVATLQNDAIYQQKSLYVQSRGMVVWRIHDHWHRWKPEPMAEGNEQLLGWQMDSSQRGVYRVGPTRLMDVAKHVAERLYSRSVRIVGDPTMMVTTIARGSHTLGGNMAALTRANVALASEVREWESVEYVRDLIASGQKKALIVISHEAGEEQGMTVFQTWMKDVTPELPVAFVPTHDRLYLI